MIIETCYMCKEPAVSREHVPPKNLFPEAKDSNGKDYRINLITVPSCELHNLKKSQDDEFLMVSLAGIIGNNSIGFEHRINKVDRAIRRSAGKLLDQVLTKINGEKTYIVEHNRFMEVIWGTPDFERLNRCFDHIARALYFSHFSEIFDGEVRIHYGFLKLDSQREIEYQAFLKHRIELDIKGKAIQGDNADIFYFQVSDKDQFGLQSIKMRFYGGLDLFAAFLPKGTALPPNPINQLRAAGIDTYIKLEGKLYRT